MHIALTSIPVDDPIKAHRFYTKILGFKSKEFMPDAQLTIVVSPDDPGGTALILGVKDLLIEVEALKGKGVRFREDLSKPEWGMDNIFEDTCGNYIMLQEAPQD